MLKLKLQLWPLDAKSWLIWKGPDAGKEWGEEEKGLREGTMVRWHHRYNGHGFRWTPGFGDGQGGLACCGSWGRKYSDTTEWLNWTELYYVIIFKPNIQNKHSPTPPQVPQTISVFIETYVGNQYLSRIQASVVTLFKPFELYVFRASIQKWVWGILTFLASFLPNGNLQSRENSCLCKF